MDKNEILKLANHQGLFSYFDLEGDSVGQLMIYTLVLDCMEVERDRIIAANAPEIEAVNTHLKALEDAVAAAERNKVAVWMIQRGYATGHSDTVEDLLAELEWQVRESEREACAKVCESLFDMDDDSCNEAEQCAAAIRARKNT